ncbi:MAG: helix-turn-helix domain-containing protein [Clostridia bacterium]|nr:helix-turn-helix domain-containing protein [Clostridia bacterium]
MKIKIGEKLKELRKEKKITQKDVYDFLKIDQTTYSKYENNKNEPDLDTVKKLADFFNVSTDYLLGRITELENVYFRLSKEATKKGISPEDLKDIMALVEKAKKRDQSTQ